MVDDFVAVPCTPYLPQTLTCLEVRSIRLREKERGGGGGEVLLVHVIRTMPSEQTADCACGYAAKDWPIANMAVQAG